MDTILAVAVGESQVTYNVNTDPPTDPVRPYIYGLIDELKKIGLGSRLIKSTIQERRQGTQTPDNCAPTCHSE